jgi:hypothetical protein
MNEAGATAISCADERDGWDYVCTFTDRVGRRRKVGLLLNADGLERASAAVAVDAPLAPPRASGDHAFDSWFAHVNSLCKRNVAKLQAVPKPASAAEFDEYVRELHRIGSQYLRALSALLPPPIRADRRVFNKPIARLEQDDKVTIDLSKAVQHGDNRAVQQLLQELGEREAREDALFNSLGRLPLAIPACAQRRS